MRFKPTNKVSKDSFMAGLYGRLSDEDRGKVNKYMDSESIKNQRDYLHYTVSQLNKEEHAIPVKIFGEYYDDDYTGITFDRPNFQEMMKEVEAGNIDCIIVKDFSRFGRDYIRIIEYLEKDFEIKGKQIRFVAYADHYDSLTDKPDIGVRILLFLNEEYSRSQSHKVTTGMESMMRAGKFIGAFAPYGYRKDPKDKHHLLIDLEVSDHVKEIFRLSLKEGLGTAEIARRMNNKGIDPPYVYKNKKGYNYKCSNYIHGNSCWTGDTINRILQDEKYTGTMVQHKTATKDFKAKEIERIAREQWIRVPDMHEAIISKEEFDAVQQLRNSVVRNRNKSENIVDNKKDNMKDDLNVFTGILKCGDCLHALIKHREKYKDKVYLSYHCRLHKKDVSKCYTNRIYYNTLSDIILKDLNTILATASDIEKVVEKYKLSDLNNSNKKFLRANIKQKREKLKMQQALLSGVEDKWLLGKLRDGKYEELKYRYESECENLNSEIHRLEAKLKKDRDIFSNKWIKALVKSRPVDKLTREMVYEAVDCIYIYHDNKVQINYKFSKELTSILENNNQ